MFGGVFDAVMLLCLNPGRGYRIVRQLGRKDRTGLLVTLPMEREADAHDSLTQFTAARSLLEAFVSITTLPKISSLPRFIKPPFRCARLHMWPRYYSQADLDVSVRYCGARDRSSYWSRRPDSLEN